MSKSIDAKKIAGDLVKEYGEVACKEIIKQLEKILETCLVNVYYSGELDEAKKEKISKWVEKKVKGYYEMKYIKDEKLISGLKIVYQDFDYEDSVKSKLLKLLWNKQ